MELPTVWERVLAASGLTFADVESMDPSTLHARLVGLDPLVRRAMAAYGHLFHNVTSLSKLHGGLIRHFLVHAARSLPREVVARLAVSPEGGVSNSAFDVTWRIVAMRDNPVIRKFISAI